MANKENQRLAQGMVADAMIPRVAELCERYKVRQLALFGSALRADFNEQSDVDVAVVFERQGFEGSFERYMGLKEALEDLFHRSVDLVSVDCLRNPVFAEEVERTQEVIYAA